MRKATVAACIVMTVAVAPFVAAAPAQASGCVTQYRWSALGTFADSSETFNASIGCDGVWAYWGLKYSDYVRGEYLSGGQFQPSSLGWQPISTGFGGGKKMIGNTVDGRTCRGISYAHAQDVYYGY
jgi:hypothetical protein